MASTVSQQITAFIGSRYPQADIADTDDIFSLGQINSLFAMELVMFVEKTFAVAIPNEELRIENFRTVEAIADLVGRLRPVDATVA
ncbi:acyl carrier protein [Streptomyces sp. NPDC056452]|uniref:acyl carrier protein n=1 Tax=Streptomyces sp. NPDC056452 TaxID=3345821 RepID=UPI0036A4A04B